MILLSVSISRYSCHLSKSSGCELDALNYSIMRGLDHNVMTLTLRGVSGSTSMDPSPLLVPACYKGTLTVEKRKLERTLGWMGFKIRILTRVFRNMVETHSISHTGAHRPQSSVFGHR
ncbi:hypothetical protein K7432_009552 [Basidiobolus ranarum]|uniref:Uncharacterized protein n=1 Tax=Basidiobolus ranarum TaxID=34480 RepID=A0ABR2WQ37_9FUNG